LPGPKLFVPGQNVTLDQLTIVKVAVAVI